VPSKRDQRPRRLTKLDLDEVSGVGRPAHREQGWAVMKSESAGRGLAKAASQPQPTRRRQPTRKTRDERRTRKEEDSMPDTPTASQIIAALRDDPELRSQVAEEVDLSKSADDGEEDVLKGLPEPVRERLEKAEEAAAQAAEEARAEKAARLDADAVRKARDDYGSLALDPTEVGPTLRRLAEHDETLAKSVEGALKAAAAQAATVEQDLFKEVGYAGGDESDAPGDRLDQLAKARAEQHGEDFATAYAQVIKSDEGRELYKSYQSERTSRLG